MPPGMADAYIATASTKATVRAGVNTALIAAQTVAGLEDGGSFNVTRAQDNKEFRAKYQPNRRGFIDKPTVLVGEGDGSEFVSSAKAVRNPTVKPYLDVIDAAQRAGTIETLNLPAVTQQLAVEGRESGGYTNVDSNTEIEIPDPGSSSTQFASVLSKLNENIDDLNEILSTPLLAEVSFFQYLDKMAEYEKIKSRS